MDFTSTLRVLAKHKILVGLLLLLTLGGTAYALASSAQTKEAAGSYVLLSAPSPQPLQTPGGPVTPVANNPFNDMEKATVVDILVRAMGTVQVAEQLKDEGLVGAYGVAGNLDFVRGPLFEVSVTSPTTEDALAGYALLDNKLNQTLKQVQLDGNADAAYLISAQRVSDPVVSTPGLIGRIRTGVTLVAVGIVFTVGFTLVVESLAQRRRERPRRQKSRVRRRRRRDRTSTPDTSTAEAAPTAGAISEGTNGGGANDGGENGDGVNGERPDRHDETADGHESPVDTFGTSSATMDWSSFAAPSALRAEKVGPPVDPTHG